MPDVNLRMPAVGPPGGAHVESARVMDAIRRLVRALRASSDASRRDFGVSTAQLFVLRQIAAMPGCSMGELAERTRTTQSSVSEVVARLVRRGLVSRQAAREDRRRAELSLTPKGRTLLERARTTLQERLLEGLESLDDDARLALASGLESWLAAAGLADIPPTMFLEPHD